MHLAQRYPRCVVWFTGVFGVAALMLQAAAAAFCTTRKRCYQSACCDPMGQRMRFVRYLSWWFNTACHCPPRQSGIARCGQWCGLRALCWLHRPLRHQQQQYAVVCEQAAGLCFPTGAWSMWLESNRCECWASAESSGTLPNIHTTMDIQQLRIFTPHTAYKYTSASTALLPRVQQFALLCIVSWRWVVPWPKDLIWSDIVSSLYSLKSTCKLLSRMSLYSTGLAWASK